MAQCVVEFRILEQGEVERISFPQNQELYMIGDAILQKLLGCATNAGKQTI